MAIPGPTIGEVMLPGFVDCAPEDTLGEVAEKITAMSVGAAVVLEYGRLVGIITERDLVKAMAARLHSSEARARQWMTPDPITAPLTMPVDDAARLMIDHGFRHLVVLGDDGSSVAGVIGLRRAVAAS